MNVEQLLLINNIFSIISMEEKETCLVRKLEDPVYLIFQKLEFKVLDL